MDKSGRKGQALGRVLRIEQINVSICLLAVIMNKEMRIGFNRKISTFGLPFQALQRQVDVKGRFE